MRRLHLVGRVGWPSRLARFDGHVGQLLLRCSSSSSLGVTLLAAAAVQVLLQIVPLQGPCVGVVAALLLVLLHSLLRCEAAWQQARTAASCLHK